jgi:hypothetical protein
MSAAGEHTPVRDILCQRLKLRDDLSRALASGILVDPIGVLSKP